MSRRAAIADDGVVLIARLDHDSRWHNAAASGAAGISRPSVAGVFFDGPGYARLPGGVSDPGADAGVVGL